MLLEDAGANCSCSSLMLCNSILTSAKPLGAASGPRKSALGSTLFVTPPAAASGLHDSLPNQQKPCPEMGVLSYW
jgi:hypothetical protein